MKSEIINRIMNNNKRIIFCLVAAIGVAAGGIGTAAYAHEKSEHQTVTYTNVPEEAKQVVSRYFGGEKIQAVIVENEHGTKEYEIKFVNGAEMEIDAKGNWEEVSVKGTDFPMAILPESIRTYLAENYASAKVVKAKYDSKGYKVKLADGRKLKFDNNGSFVKIDK